MVARGALLYQNSLATPEDVAGFRLEGQASVTHEAGSVRLTSVVDEAAGQAANYVWWCPQEFPPNVWIEWDFWPEAERGLCIAFFSARGRGGEDLFDPSLPPRTGTYREYHSGALNALHVSYYRRREPRAALNVCNLRKSHGFHLVASAADPIPAAHRSRGPHRLRLVKAGPHAALWIGGLPVLYFQDDGLTYGPQLVGGKFGLRQMAPMIGRYANLGVWGVADAAAFDWLAELRAARHDEG